jgi:alanyl-tRNA synthetase
MRVVAEHGRAVAFLIADGVLPSNEGRGYVLRRLLRRGVLFGRRLGMDKPFLADMAAAAIEQKGSFYPELVKRRDFILDVIRREEERFAETLNTGLELLDEIMQRGDTINKCITGEAAFKLYDTYGFPVEITREIASSQGFEVDIEGFETEMDKQREKARAANKFGGEETDTAEFDGEFEPTRFTGYNALKGSTRIVGLIVANEGVNDITAEQKAGVVLEDTPFYAEMGGQVGDTGVIRAEGGLFTVLIP